MYKHLILFWAMYMKAKLLWKLGQYSVSLLALSVFERGSSHWVNLSPGLRKLLARETAAIFFLCCHPSFLPNKKDIIFFNRNRTSAGFNPGTRTAWDTQAWSALECKHKNIHLHFHLLFAVAGHYCLHCIPPT